ncbi:divalent-cation tolerance protein CutA [Nocardia takedensis]
MAEHVVVTTTTDTEEAALGIARGVVENRLGACAQIHPLRSVFRWEGEVQDETEWRVDIKTVADKVSPLIDHIESVHSYDVPEVIVTPIVAGSEAYLRWLGTETH